MPFEFFLFDFSIIESVIDKHITSDSDLTVVLNYSCNNLCKKWDYIIRDGFMLQVKAGEQKKLSRYC